MAKPLPHNNVESFGNNSAAILYEVATKNSKAGLAANAIAKDRHIRALCKALWYHQLWIVFHRPWKFGRLEALVQTKDECFEGTTNQTHVSCGKWYRSRRGNG
jgi:hypothetical protein